MFSKALLCLCGKGGAVDFCCYSYRYGLADKVILIDVGAAWMIDKVGSHTLHWWCKMILSANIFFFVHIFYSFISKHNVIMLHKVHL